MTSSEASVSSLRRTEMHGAVDSIADDIWGRVSPQIGTVDGMPLDLSVGRGLSGLLVLYAYLADRRGSDSRSRVYALAEHLLTALAEDTVEINLFGGCIGVGWSLAHVQCEFPSLALDIDLSDLDDLAVRVLLQYAGDLRYDLITGLVGFGVYGLERGNAARAAEIVELVVKHLEDRVEESGSTVSWRTPATHLSPDSRAANPNGLYDLGVAHGTAGVLAFLASAREFGVVRRGTTTLLEQAAQSLIRMRTTCGLSGFPYSISDTEPPRNARMAWCYGAPGVVVALLRVAKAIGCEELSTAASSLCVRSAGTPIAESGVRDAGLCHGATGVAHLFARASAIEPRLVTAKVASQMWFKHALAMKASTGGIGGFFSLKAESGLVESPGFLEGATGVALALEAAVTERDPVWDRVLLMSSPRERTGA